MKTTFNLGIKQFFFKSIFNVKFDRKFSMINISIQWNIMLVMVKKLLSIDQSSINRLIIDIVTLR